MTDQPAEPSLAGLPLTGLLDELIGWSDRLHARITYPDAEDRVNAIRATIMARFGGDRVCVDREETNELEVLEEEAPDGQDTSWPLRDVQI